MARSKADVTKNIRKKIAGTSPITDSKEVKNNLELSKKLHGISSHIETLTANQQDLFKQLIAAVQEIPKNNAALQKQQKKVLDNLIKATELLKTTAENETDPEKKKELETAVDAMEDRGSEIQKNTDDSPRGIREVIGARHGINPLEVREKGLLRAGFSNLNRKVFGGSYNPSESTEPPAKNLKEKTRDNVRGVQGLEKIMKSLLTEVSVIRKVVEGRMKFDPKTKGYTRRR
jgi:flagellar biosynthesis GTPase FlhF